MPMGIWNAVCQDFAELAKIPGQALNMKDTTAWQIADSTQAVIGSGLTVTGVSEVAVGVTKLGKAGVTLAKDTSLVFVTKGATKRLVAENGGYV